MTNSAVNSLINPPAPRPDQVFSNPNTRHEFDRDQVDRFDDYIENDYADQEPTRNDVRDRTSRDDDQSHHEDHPDKERFDDYNRDASYDASDKDETASNVASTDNAKVSDRQDQATTTEPTHQDEGDNLDAANGSGQTDETETAAKSETPTDAVAAASATIPNPILPAASTGLATGTGTADLAQTTADPATLAKEPSAATSAASQQAATNSSAAQPSNVSPAAAEQNPAQAPILQKGASDAQATVQISSVQQNGGDGVQTPSAPMPTKNVSQQNGNQANPASASTTATASGPLGATSGHEEIAATVTNSGIDVRKEIAGQNKPQDGNASVQASTQGQSGKNSEGNAAQIAAQSTQNIPSKLTSDPAPLITASAPESASIDLRTQPMGTFADFNRPIEKQPMVLTIRAATSGGNPSLPVDTLALHISRNLSNGVNKFQIRLDPPELGRIDVKMEVGQDGRVQTTLAADRPETLDLLQRDAKLLQRALDDAGLKSDNGSLNFSLRDQEGNSGQSANAGSNDQGSAAQDDQQVDPEIAENAAHYIADLDTGRVDIRI